MSYKVFDFKCPKEECPAFEENVMIDLEKEDPPVCPECGTKMVIMVGTVWKRHISWSKWRV